MVTSSLSPPDEAEAAEALLGIYHSPSAKNDEQAPAGREGQTISIGQPGNGAAVPPSAAVVDTFAEQQQQQQPSPSEKKEEEAKPRKSPEKTPRRMSSANAVASAGGELKQPPELLAVATQLCLPVGTTPSASAAAVGSNPLPSASSPIILPKAAVSSSTAAAAPATAQPKEPKPPPPAKKKRKHASKTIQDLQKIKAKPAVTQFLASHMSGDTGNTTAASLNGSFISSTQVKNNGGIHYNQRINVPGSILDIANRVTDGGDTPIDDKSSDTIMDPPTGTSSGSNGYNMESHAAKFPIMAPPMSFDDTNTPTDEAALYNDFLPHLGKKKKRRRIAADDTDTTTATTTKNKKKKGRKSNPTTSGMKRSDSLNESTNYQYQDVRILPDPTPKPKQYAIVSDTSPQRQHNPLLSLPILPHGEHVGIDEIPTGGELWNMTDLVYCDADTFPISYLARILGFDLPVSGVGVPFGERLDLDSLSVKRKDDDPWMDVPRLGSFVDKVWRQSENDDDILSRRDPLWVNILQTFRGYNESDFKDAGKGYAAHLSPLVLEFAKERGIVNEEISFRLATPDDEAVLSVLEGKCKSKCAPKQDLATSLRTPGLFVIIAESAEKVPVAFVQYRFCWYKVEEKKAGSNLMTSYGVKSRAGEGVDKVSELVFFIDNVIYDDTDGSVDTAEAEEATSPSKLPDMETARVLLMSLALLHAWSHDIWYGMMEAPDAVVPFYAKYFRMAAAGKQATNDETNEANAFLVCDLKKCSFRYAIHVREESLKADQQSKPPAAAQSINQRMLVHLPDASTSFSNATEAKQVHVRIEIPQQGEAAPEIVSVSVASGQETIRKVESSSLENISADWNAFKLFSADKKATNTETTTSNNADDFFLAELIKKQNELKTLESSIEDTSRFLLGEAYNDAIDFHLGDRRAKKDREKQILKDFEAVKQRLHEADMAWQAQLEQDMDAVCDVCWDGEVTPENQIIFCDSCNVAVHQGCYGIDKVPSGNYFCHPCIHNGKNNEFLAAERQGGARTAPTRTPVICELCPRRQGAFVQTETAPDSLRKPRWVHVGCAKWSGLNYIDIEKKDMIENVAELKDMYQQNAITCVLCKSGIGAMHQCRVEGCNKWLHLTCARCVGTCSVQHGENCEGLYPADSIPHPAWTLACIEHSEVDPETIRKNSITVDQLKAIAKSYPPEPVPPKPFNKLNAKERREYWADRDNLEKFVNKVQTIKVGAYCAVCGSGKFPIDFQCDKCKAFFHSGCVGTSGECYGCKYTEEHADSPDYKVPNCRLCKYTQGPVLKTLAKPVSMKKWRGSKSKIAEFQKSLFGPNTFSHVLCGYWNPLCLPIETNDETVICTTEIVMAHGNGFIQDKQRCIVCGFTYGARVQCMKDGCDSGWMHVTCARAAGFEVSHDDDKSESGFILKCFHHSENANNFRAMLEDLLEVEICRSKAKKFDKGFYPMTWDHAASLYHSAVNILRVLGWAWRWADWWVADGDTWEPLLEDDQVEEEMTQEELKIVPSTPESRCEDARKCRLAAFGAALRNRDYDKVEGGDEQPLERALRAILSVPSLVGPLKKKEIEFHTLWLSLAYRSKSPLLGFGDDKIPVADKDICLHIADGSPKYELGSRPLPGLAEPENDKTNFEPTVEEVDDFLKIREKPNEEKSRSKKK